MKQFILALCLLVSFNFFGQNVINVEGANSSSFYLTIEQAISNAIDGDTIYLPSGVFGLSNSITLNKRLHFYGKGYNINGGSTGTSIVNANIILQSGASESFFQGIEFFGSIGANWNVDADSLVFSRCKINWLSLSSNGGNPCSTDCNNWNINECLIGNFNPSSTSFTKVKNSIIDDYFGSNNCNGSNNVFENCVLRYTRGEDFYGSDQFENCVILLEDDSYNTSDMNSVIINSLFISEFALPLVGSNEIIGDTLLVNDTTGIFLNTIEFPLFENYALNNLTISPSSLAFQAGTDGTDLGIYGGSFPWKEGALPSNPVFTIFDISPFTNPDGQLEINIQVEGQSY